MGLDGKRRETLFQFDPPPARLTSFEASYDLDLAPNEWIPLFSTISVTGMKPEREGRRAGFFVALRAKFRDHRMMFAPVARIETSNNVFNETLRRSGSDLAMLVTETAAGGLSLCGNPMVQHGLRPRRDHHRPAARELRPRCRGRSAALSGGDAGARGGPAADAEPGKILHETRGGEMAMLGEVPFRRYYGSVDSTPLFVMLAGAYFERTGDMGLIEELWPNIEAALSWIDRYGDRDGDGFVEYGRRNQTGLANQGWKDSHDSVFHADGAMAEGPIALVEVQGYVYAARARRRRSGAAAWVTPTGRPCWKPRRKPCAAGSRTRSGARKSAPTRWRWMGPSGNAGCGRPMPGTRCSAGSRRRIGRRGWRRP